MNKKYPLAISYGRAVEFRKLGIFQHTEYVYNPTSKKAEELLHISNFKGMDKSELVRAASLLDMCPLMIALSENMAIRASQEFILKHGAVPSKEQLFNCNYYFDAIMDAIEQKQIDINEIKLILAKEAQDNQQSQTNH